MEQTARRKVGDFDLIYVLGISHIEQLISIQDDFCPVQFIEFIGIIFC